MREYFSDDSVEWEDEETGEEEMEGLTTEEVGELWGYDNPQLATPPPE